MAADRRKMRKGSALVEFALMAPLLLLLLAGVLNYAWAIRTAASVANAARVGAQYGSRTPGASSDTTGIRAAALDAVPDISGLTVNSARVCKCPNGTTVSCTGDCGSDVVIIYVQVTAEAVSPSIFSYSGLPFTGRASVTATMRAQ
jgi:Flp pilus assembly protein TadG